MDLRPHEPPSKMTFLEFFAYNFGGKPKAMCLTESSKFLSHGGTLRARRGLRSENIGKFSET